MNKLLGLASALEAVTGLALIVDPAWVTKWLLDRELSGAGVAVGPIAGLALPSLGLASWPGRGTARGSGPALRALLVYNVLITAYLAELGLTAGAVGRPLWPAVAVHATLTLLLGRGWLEGVRSAWRHTAVAEGLRPLDRGGARDP